MKITIYLASAANGQISNNRNVPDWLSNEYGMGFMEITQRMQAVIMGKTTYDFLAGGGHLPFKDYGTLLVLTHDTKAKPAQDNVVFTDLAPAGIVQLLEARGHSEAVIIGGTQTVSAFVQAELVDEVILVVEPVLFGLGLPMLAGVDKEIKMTLKDVQQVNEHTVKLHYAIKRNG